jgi:RNA polymerase sigma factor (sigma-70 family)
MDEVLSKCLRGEKRAWDAFVDRYAGVIFAAVRRVLRGRGPGGEEAAVEDMTQEVFLRLVKNDFRLLRTYDPGRASLVTWLTIVARSTAIDLLRRKRLPTVSLDEAAPVEASAPPAGPAEPADVTAELPPGLLTARQKLLLHLLFDREMTPAAAAELLGVSAQTVRSTKYKAIQKLRKYFASEDSS